MRSALSPRGSRTIDFSPIQEFADQIGPALGEFAGQAGDVLLPILSELGPMLTQAAQGGAPLQAMFAAIVPHLQTIGTAVLGLLPSLVSFGSAVLPVIMGAVSSLIPLIVQIASTAIPAVLGVVQALLPIAQNIVTTLIPMIVSGIQTLIPQILGIIDPLMSIVHTVIDLLGPAINFLLPIVQLVFSNVVTIIGGAIGVVTGILTAVAALLRGDFAGAWQAIQGIVGTVIGTVKEYVNNGLNFVREHFGTVIETVKTTVSNGFQTVVDTVSTKIGEVVGFVQELPGKILDGLGNLGDLLLGSGKALMDGFTQGIKNGVQGAIDAASGAVQSVRDFFPFSPAKRGPFSGSGYTDRSGKALVGDFAKAMTSEISTVTRAADKVATAGTFEAGFDLNRRPGAGRRAQGAGPRPGAGACSHRGRFRRRPDESRRGARADHQRSPHADRGSVMVYTRPGRLYRKLTPDQPLFRFTTEQGTDLRDGALTGLTIKRGNGSPGGGIAPSTLEAGLTGFAAIQSGNHCTLSLTSYGAQLLADRVGASASSIQPRFTGRVGKQTVDDRGRRQRTTMYAASWTAQLGQVAKSYTPTVGENIATVISELMTSPALPRLNGPIRMATPDQYGTVHQQEDEQTYSNIGKWTSDLGLLVRDHRAGTQQLMTHAQRWDDALERMDYWLPVIRSQALAPSSWEQSSTTIPRNQRHDLGIRRGHQLRRHTVTWTIRSTLSW